MNHPWECFPEIELRLKLRTADCILVRLNAVKAIMSDRGAYVLTYLQPSGLRLGLIVNLMSLISTGAQTCRIVSSTTVIRQGLPAPCWQGHPR